MNKFEDYLTNMAEIKNALENFPLEIEKGTKKMKEKYHSDAVANKNLKIMELISKYKKDLKKVYDALLKEKKQLEVTEEKTEIQMKEKRIKLLRKTLKYSNPYNDYADKTNFRKIIMDMDNIENSNLREVNHILIYVLNKFNTANIKLTEEDFNYSLYTKDYMSLFLKVKNDDNFEAQMSSKFDSIYWSCPNLLTHLKLNVITLISKYEKEITIFAETKKKNLYEQAEVNTGSIKLEFYAEKMILDRIRKQDDFNNLNIFLNKEDQIENYLSKSEYPKAILKKYLMNDENEVYIYEDAFLEELIDFNNALEETSNYQLFMPIFIDIKKRYEESKNKKPNLKVKLKEIKKKEKLKDQKINKYLKISLKNKTPRKENKLKKISSEVNALIDEINILYREYEELRINDKIITNLDSESTLYDAIVLASSFYTYVKILILKEFKSTSIEEVDEMIKRFYNFVYNPYNEILDKFNLFEKHDFKLLIKNKYMLSDIKIEDEAFENIDIVKDDLKFVDRYYNLNKSKLKPEDIEFILKVNSL